MTDQELARALFEAGILTQEQVQTAAAQRSATQNFAQIVVQMGWVSPAQIAQFDPNALGAQTPPPAPPLQPPPPMPSAPPGYGASSYGTPAPRVAEVSMDAIGQAWNMITSQMGVWLPAMLLFFVIVYGVQAPFQIMAAGAQTQVDPNNPFGAAMGANLGLTLMSSVISTIVTTFLVTGLTKMALKQIDGQAISIGEMFSGGPYFLQVLLAYIVFYIIGGIGFLLCCIPGIIFACGMMFMTPLIVDKQMDAITAMKTSWETLKPHLGATVLFAIVCGLASMLGVIACGIGIIFTYPLLFIGPAIVYRGFFPAGGSTSQDQGNYPPPPIPSPF